MTDPTPDPTPGPLELLARAFVKPAKRSDRRRLRPGANRRALIVDVDRGDDGQPRSAVLFETLDGVPIAVTIAIAPAVPAEDRDALAARCSSARLADHQPGVPAVPERVDWDDLGPLIVRRCYRQGVALVAWDLWDLVALAEHVGWSPDGSASLRLPGCGVPTGGDRWFYPRLRIGQRWSSWGAPRSTADRLPKGRRPGPILPLNRLCAALCGGEVDQPLAAELLDVVLPIGPADPLVPAHFLARLHGAARSALDDAASDLAPERPFSTGSLAQHEQDTAGVISPALKAANLSSRVLGGSASAFAGGHFAAHLVGVAMGMAALDQSASYATQHSLAGQHRFLSCREIRSEDAAADVASFAALPEAKFEDALYERDTHRRFGATFVLVAPDGEHFPSQVRRSDGEVASAVAPLFGNGLEIWVTWQHYCAARLRSGRAPEVRSAFRLVPVGRQDGLSPLRLPSGRLVDLATEDLGQALIADRLAIAQDPSLSDAERRRVRALAKLFANALCFGNVARHDLLPRAVPAAVLGPNGDIVATSSTEVPGPAAFLALAAIPPAGCDLMVAMATVAIERAGGTIAAVAADAIVVPCSPDGGIHLCPGGPIRLDDGTEAVRLLTPAQLREVFARFDPLLRPRGGAGWAEVAGSLSEPTVGLVCGVNRTLLGRRQPDGSWLLTRSSDANMGGHLDHPDETGERLDDDHFRWAAVLEAALLAANADAPTSGPIAVPDDLAPWADDHAAVRSYRATTRAQVRRISDRVGHAVRPGSTYSVADKAACVSTDGGATWWRAGAEVRLAVFDPRIGALVVVGGRSGRLVQGVSIREHLARWARDVPPAGPARGLRPVVPVVTHPSLLQVVGRTGHLLTALDEDPETDAALLVYGPGDLAALRVEAMALGIHATARVAGVSRSRARHFIQSRTDAPDIARAVARAVIERTPDHEPDDEAELPTPVPCTAFRVDPAAVAAVIDRLAGLRGLGVPGPLARAALGRSEDLRRAVDTLLATGLDAAAIAAAARPGSLRRAGDGLATLIRRLVTLAGSPSSEEVP